MAVKIRLRRMGRKKRPIYGVVAADIRSPRDGRFIEDLGRYNPIAEPAKVALNGERILYWLSKGAQPTDTVRNLLRRDGLLLAFDMQNKGASAEEIETAIAEFKAAEAEKAADSKMTARQRKQAALQEEAKAVAAREAEEARIRAEAEAAARAAAEEAQRKADEERKRKQAAEAAQAKAEQEAANAAQAAADSESAPEAAKDAPEAVAEGEAAATEETKAE